MNLSIFVRLSTLVVILLLGIFVFVFLKFEINVPGRLERAQLRWEENEIVDYYIKYSFYSLQNINQLEFQVMGGEIVSISETLVLSENLVGVYEPDAAFGWYDENFAEVFPSQLSSYSVEGMFNYLQEIPYDKGLVVFCTRNERYDVSFDREYGYLQEMSFDSQNDLDWGVGIMCPLPHLGSRRGVHVTGFRVIESEVR